MGLLRYLMSGQPGKIYECGFRPDFLGGGEVQSFREGVDLDNDTDTGAFQEGSPYDDMSRAELAAHVGVLGVMGDTAETPGARETALAEQAAMLEYDAWRHGTDSIIQDNGAIDLGYGRVAEFIDPAFFYNGSQEL
ncbi:MAG TPA: hypothetical protein VJP80_01805 [Candidatus Saccharimonadales bacterium]|nr:hypothetical protein [Candidatus Saccharimonadales bacterium]